MQGTAGDIRTDRLTAFFAGLRRFLEDRFAARCLDEGAPQRFVATADACLGWFERTDGKPRRQLFGSFFDVGAAPYFLHVALGTVNLHVGVVRGQLTDGRLTLRPMGAFDQARIAARLNPRLPKAAQLSPRSWGPVWCSADRGDFRPLDVPDVAAAALDFTAGALATGVIAPLAAALPGFARDRAWAWAAVDRRQWWRFFVDGRFHQKYAGWRGYEAKEAGSVQGMLNAFAFVLEQLDRAADLDVPYLLELHRRCMAGVHSGNRKSTPGQTRFRPAGFLFYAKTSTLASLAEVFALRRGDGTPLFHEAGYDRSADEMDFLEAHEGLRKLGQLRFRPWYPVVSKDDRDFLERQDGSARFLAMKEAIQAQYLPRMQQCLDVYSQAMAAATQDLDRIAAIARLVRDLELLHPFPDGNGRCFPVALACQLLMYHGFPPPMYRDPNIDAELSYAEFTAETVAAMHNTLALLRDPEAALFDWSIKESPAADIDAFAGMAREVSARADLLGRDPISVGHAPAAIAAADDEPVFATPDYAAWVTGGHWVGYDPTLRFTNVGSHRTFRRGALYFGLAIADWTAEGKSVDEELARVIERGAVALVLDGPVEPGRFPVPVLAVKNMEAARKALAQRVRRDVGCATVLVTGTEGKTGAKCQLHHVLKRQTSVHAVLNSANTEGPVLTSLANLTAATRVEINEVSVGAIEGMRVERAKLVGPDLCLFTNIGPNHMDMHKTIENILLAKSSVVEGLPPGGGAILNADNEFYGGLHDAILRRRPDVQVLTYGSGPGHDGRLVEAGFDADRMGWHTEAVIEGRTVRYFVPLAQAYAPLASVGVLLTVNRLGFDVAQAAHDYLDFLPFETMGRLLRLQLPDGAALFYDQSRRGGLHGMRSAFQDLPRLAAGRRVVALVGGISIKRDSDWTRQAHGELAELINASPIARLYTTGDYMDYVHAGLRTPPVRHGDDIAALADWLAEELRPDDLLFIIGSAYLYLGRVSELLLKRLPHSILHCSDSEPPS